MGTDDHICCNQSRPGFSEAVGPHDCPACQKEDTVPTDLRELVERDDCCAQDSHETCGCHDRIDVLRAVLLGVVEACEESGRAAAHAQNVPSAPAIYAFARSILALVENRLKGGGDGD